MIPRPWRFSYSNSPSKTSPLRNCIAPFEYGLFTSHLPSNRAKEFSRAPSALFHFIFNSFACLDHCDNLCHLAIHLAAIHHSSTSRSQSLPWSIRLSRSLLPSPSYQEPPSLGIENLCIFRDQYWSIPQAWSISLHIHDRAIEPHHNHEVELDWWVTCSDVVVDEFEEKEDDEEAEEEADSAVVVVLCFWLFDCSSFSSISFFLPFCLRFGISTQASTCRWRMIRAQEKEVDRSRMQHQIRIHGRWFHSRFWFPSPLLHVSFFFQLRLCLHRVTQPNGKAWQEARPFTQQSKGNRKWLQCKRT